MSNNETIEEICGRYVSVVNVPSIATLRIFSLMIDEVPDVEKRRQVLDALEDRLIAQATQIGADWGHQWPSTAAKESDKIQALGWVLSRIAQIKEDQAQDYTRLFSREYEEMSGDKELPAREVAACFSIAADKITQAATVTREAMEAHLTAATQQQKLNRRAAAHKLRIMP